MTDRPRKDDGEWLKPICRALTMPSQQLSPVWFFGSGLPFHGSSNKSGSRIWTVLALNLVNETIQQDSTPWSRLLSYDENLLSIRGFFRTTVNDFRILLTSFYSGKKLSSSFKLSNKGSQSLILFDFPLPICKEFSKPYCVDIFWKSM